MNNVIADALVVGGGIAGGALAAYLARAGRHVIVIERQPGPRDKVCGEFISAEAAYYLRELAIDLNALGAFAISSVRAYTEKHAASAPLPFEAFSISRRALDEAVLRRASSWGAEVWRGCVVRSLQGRDGHWIAKLDGNATVIAHAAFLATGKHDLKGFKRPPAVKTIWSGSNYTGVSQQRSKQRSDPLSSCFFSQAGTRDSNLSRAGSQTSASLSVVSTSPRSAGDGTFCSQRCEVTFRRFTNGSRAASLVGNGRLRFPQFLMVISGVPEMVPGAWATKPP
jgi:hypothetical protein